MQINITGHHVDVTGPLRDYVDSKLERIVRHYDQLVSVHIVLSVEKLRHTAEARLHVAGNDLFADATDEDMYAAIDALADKLDRQITKHKEKSTDHHRSEKARSYP
jgi:putative sigma-54 modulation protein